MLYSDYKQNTYIWKKNSEAEKRIIFMINLASQNGQHTLVFLGN